MSFDERYQLFDLAEDLGPKTFVGREISTGKRVSVFLFVGEQAHKQEELLNKLRSAEQVQFPELIEVGDNQGTPYIVTEPIGGFSELKNRVSHLRVSHDGSPEHKPGEFLKAGVWRVPPSLQGTAGNDDKISGEAAIAGTQQATKNEARPEAGSFTQMFQASAPPIGESLPEGPKAAPPVVPPPPQPAPGSFTQMFQTSAPPIGEAKPEVPKPTPPVTPPPQPAPGSFTQMFQTSAPPIGEATPEVQKSTPPVTPPPQPAPGSFTQMFQAPAPPIGEAKPEVQKSTPPATPHPTQLAPGEFTRFFNAAPSAPAASIPVPKRPEDQGEFERIFGAGDRVTTPPSTVTGIFDQSSSMSPLKQGESPSFMAPPRAYTPPAGEFTRIFGETLAEIPTQGPMAPAPPTSSPQAPAGAPGEYTRMFGSQPSVPEPIAQPAPAPVRVPDSPAPAKQNSKLVPVLIGVIVLLLATIAVILVAMRK